MTVLSSRRNARPSTAAPGGPSVSGKSGPKAKPVTTSTRRARASVSAAATAAPGLPNAGTPRAAGSRARRRSIGSGTRAMSEADATARAPAVARALLHRAFVQDRLIRTQRRRAAGAAAEFVGGAVEQHAPGPLGRRPDHPLRREVRGEQHAFVVGAAAVEHDHGSRRRDVARRAFLATRP